MDDESDDSLEAVKKTELQDAVLSDDLERVRALIPRNDCRVDDVTRELHATPLTLACHLGRIECTEALLEAGADVNGKPSNVYGGEMAHFRYLPVEVACGNGHR